MPQTLARPVVPRHRRGTALYAGVAVAFAAAAIPLIGNLQDLPRTEVRVTNESPWDIGVELVLDDGRHMPLSTIPAETTVAVQEVAVPGDTWRVRWTFRGEEVAQSDIPDSRLRDADNQLTVPGEVTTALEAVGAPPAP